MRAGYLDALRGLAVVWMIIFHAAYDMRMFNFVTWDFSSGFWYGFPRVIAFTFLFCVGISLNYTHTPQVNWNSLKKRSLKLGVSAAIISLGTYYLYPSNWIFFGTLHCIFVGSILGSLVVNHKKFSFLLLVGILIMQYALSFDIKWVSSIFNRPSLDFIPIYPWFWAILLGIVSGPFLSKNKNLMEMNVPKPLKFLGQHSLKVYLIHQPLIFGALWLINSVL
jgi:uncharacterized membrane protein